MSITPLRPLVSAIFIVALLAAIPAVGHPLNEDIWITAADGTAGDQFGRSVAMSGNIAIVGSITNGGAGPESGSAYLFDTTTGQQIAKLAASDAAAGDRLGWSVAISDRIAIVGAYLNDDAGPESGSAYLFDTTTGQQIAKLTADDASGGDQFGLSVAISGTIAIVGARADDDAGSESGSAYIFDTATGQQIFKLTASDAAAGDQFGYSVGVCGTIAIVGAYLNDDAGSESGSAYLFDTTTGQQIAKLTAADGEERDQFGFSVAVSGHIAIVGSRGDDDAGFNSGSAYLFDVTTGQQVAKLTASDARSDEEFGSSVAISGTTAIIGAFHDSHAGTGSGSAYLFDATAGQQIVKLTASDAEARDWFGHVVAISGSAAIVGAPLDDDPEPNAGSAYLFQGSPVIIAQPQSNIADFGATATFQVELANPNSVNYQWRRSGTNLADGGNISGSNTATLKIVAGEADEAFYDCMITSWGSSGLTHRVVLAVLPDPDPCFADVNGDAILNFTDVLLYINAFNTSCP